jgi:glycosyltransferase involved in cell wall biosynthesis
MKPATSSGPKEKYVWLGTCGAWYLPRTARALYEKNALAGLWISEKNSAGLPPELYRRCWPFHLALKLFYHWASQIWKERLFYFFFPLWRLWQLAQKWPEVSVVHAIAGYATEPFDHAEKVGALKVIDCPNSHPTSYYGYWQRECDLWCPGENVPIPRWFFARMSRELRRADMILCPSLFVRDTMVNNGIAAGKCFVNPFGVDTSIFKPRSTLPDRPRFISVGTICVRKGFQYLFRAFEKVKETLPDAELIVVGGYKVDFRMERKKWENNFTQIGHLDHKALADLLPTCSAFVFLSLEEGFARVIPEAMASGLPIIATHESGATTLVKDGVEGIIVPPGDYERAAEAMLHVARDQELNLRMGAAAYEKVALKNTWQDYGDRLITEYAKRMASRLPCASIS